MSEQPEYNDTSMFGFLERVAEYLRELTQLNLKLLGALTEYRRLLIEGATDAIERATPKLDRIAGEIRVIDEKRRMFVDSYFTAHDWNGPRNFSAISERVRESDVSDEEAAAFERASRARMELISVLAEVDAQNSLNLTLIGQGMSFAEVGLKALLGLERNPSTYGPTEGAEEGPSFLDAHA